MTNWNARVLRIAAMACAVFAAGSFSFSHDAAAQDPQVRPARLGPKPSTLKRSENTSPLPRDRLFFNYNYFSAAFQGGGTFGRTNGDLSGTFGPTPPRGSANVDRAFIGGDFQIPLSILFSPQSMSQAPMRLPFTPIVGVAVGDFLGNGDPIRFVIHPTPNPTTLTFQRETSATFYGGVRVAVGDLLGNGSQVVITPRAGVNVQNGRVILITDEAGPVTRLSRSTTATGFHGGVDIDMFFPSGSPTFRGGANIANTDFMPFVGVGVAVDTIPNASLFGRSALFDYHARTSSDVNVTVKGRIGVAFGAR